MIIKNYVGHRWDVCEYLEVPSCGEREAGQVRLLGAPALRQEGVSDEDSFLQTRVQMKSDVAAAGNSQVHTETVTQNDRNM